MKEKTKEAAFFIAMFLLIVWLISFLAPSDATTAPAMQNVFSELSAVDWMMVFIAIGAIPLTLLTVYYLQTREASAPQLQPEWGRGEAMEVERDAIPAPMEERVIVVKSGAAPEIVNRLRSELTSVHLQRDALQRELQALRVEHQQLLRARQSAPEPERELSYQAVRALLLAGNVGIKEAIKVIRANNGTVGKKSYQALKNLLPLLPPCPIPNGSPEIAESQAMNCEPAPVNQATEPEPESGQGRGIYRRLRDRGRAKVFVVRKDKQDA